MVAVVEDREAAEGDVLLVLVGEDVLDRVVRVEADGRLDEAVEVVLDLADLLGLLLGGEVLVDDADAAVEGHGDRHGRFRHGVHRRAEEGGVDVDARGEAGGGGGFVGEEVRVLGHERDIVVGEGFAREVRHEGGDIGIHMHC